MRLIKRIVCVVLIFAFCVTVTGCHTVQPLETKVPLKETTVTTQPPTAETTQPDGTVSKIIFSAKFLTVVDLSPEEWSEALDSMSDGQYVDTYVSEDGKSVTLEITEEHRNYWIESRKEILAELQEEFSAENPDYRIEVSEDYSNIDFYYNLDKDPFQLIVDVLNVETVCVFMQLLNGVGAEDWFVTVNIYNSDTGKLVTSGDSNTGLGYEAEDWEASK